MISPHEKFKQDDYLVCENFISKELSNFLYEYFKMQTQVSATCNEKYGSKVYNNKPNLLGEFTDPQALGDYSKYADIAFETLMRDNTHKIEKLTGLTLVPTYSYARLYTNGSELVMHKDRGACEISITLCLGYDSNSSWPMYVEAKPIYLEPGDIIVYRGSNEKKLYDLINFSTVPIINGLTDQSHPCQIIADILTLQENFKTLDNLNICWVGDGNNVCNSWIHACQHFDYNLNISCPEDSFPDEKIIRNYKSSRINIFKDPFEAVKGADVIVTDTWVSMGMKEDPKRLKKFERFQVNKSLMEKTQKQTLFLHCLPAHRGCEVTDEIIDGRNSLVWSEAENRLYAHQAILLWCLNLI